MVDGPEIRDALPDGPARGRGSQVNPGNRFESTRLHVLGEHLDRILVEYRTEEPEGHVEGQPHDPDWSGGGSRGRTGGNFADRSGGNSGDRSGGGGRGQVLTEVFVDKSRSVLNKVDSPDVGFNWSLNPYRGCEHGCVYCYARPYHEMLGFSCGLDFETKIMAKPDAPRLLRRALAGRNWRGETIAMSGVTDCYQPVEAKLGITRGCLEVLAECRQPVGIVTKNRLVLRDLDLLKQLARINAVVVAISVTTLDRKLASQMEPRASCPADRLSTIEKLSNAGVPVLAMIAPIIPGINDREIPQLLKAVADAGARSARYTLLRLPYQVKEVFMDWLGKQFPDRAARVEALLRQTRQGELTDAQFGRRMRGSGPIARQIREIFRIFATKYSLTGSARSLSSRNFRRPCLDGQLDLF